MKYTERRDMYRQPFPAAFRFLRDVEALGEADPRFEYETDKNLHLYFDRQLLAYIVLDLRRNSPPTLVFSTRQVKLPEGYGAAPQVPFVDTIRELIVDQHGFQRGWANEEEDEDTGATGIRLRFNSPTMFWEELAALIHSIGAPDDDETDASDPSRP